ncbi:MAG: acyl-CoA dehydrogenase [Alphaproteobacteria bacterium]
MDFRFSQDALDLADGARSFLDGANPQERLRSQDGRDSLWPQLAALGLLGVLAPESAGGLGLHDDSFVLIAEAAGRVCLPEPLVALAAISVPAVLATYPDEVGGLVRGDHVSPPVHPLAPYVHDADKADAFIIAGPDALYGVPSSKARLTPVKSIDPNRNLFRVEADLTDELKVGDADLCAVMAVRGSTYTAAQLLGLTDAMIQMATDYAKEREQFGQPIGGFQAIKHHLASAQVKLEFARPVVYRAAASLDVDSIARQQVHAAHAKIAANEAARFATEVAIQVHGAMGYTFEVDLHYFMKRAWALETIWGDTAHHSMIINQAVIDGGLDIGPGTTFDAA